MVRGKVQEEAEEGQEGAADAEVLGFQGTSPAVEFSANTRHRCPVCRRKIHPQGMRCRLCSVVMHREWGERPHPDDPHVCLDCAPREGLREVRRASDLVSAMRWQSILERMG